MWKPKLSGVLIYLHFSVQASSNNHSENFVNFSKECWHCPQQKNKQNYIYIYIYIHTHT